MLSFKPAYTDNVFSLDGQPIDDTMHPLGHQCKKCEPHVPSVPRRLDAVAIGKLMTAGFAIASAILLVIDPRGFTAAIAACFGVSW